jgi:uncharacterized membrane protein
MFLAFSSFVMRAARGARPAPGHRHQAADHRDGRHARVHDRAARHGLGCVVTTASGSAAWHGSFGSYLLAASGLYRPGALGVTIAYPVLRSNQLPTRRPDSPQAAHELDGLPEGVDCAQSPAGGGTGRRNALSLAAAG